MALEPGTRLGPYEVTAAIGAGGMGEVYQARDTSLNRDVAIKVLPEALAGDADRLARFQREAEALAALNHLNIAQVYGLEQSGETPAIVMELVEGPTLADRIATGPIPIDEALPIARQIAEALDAAHERGIIHRDLKPANVKVKDDGTVKVLDFGLAKAMDPAGRTGAGSSTEMANSPTLTARATQMGVVLGTAAYMAPEQAKGRPVDKRADVWAFGVVLFEMLAGQRPFGGSDVTEVMAGVIKSDPEWQALPATTPRAIERLLRRCLVKPRNERLRDIGDARLELDAAASEPTDLSSESPVAARPPAWRQALPVVAAVALTSLVAWSLWPSPADSGADVMRVRLDLGPGQHLSGGYAMETEDFGRQRPSRPSFALSPDGRDLVYAASDGETTRLYRRSMSQDLALPMPGTDGGAWPFFAPDGQSVGFVVDGELKRVPIDGGEVRTIAVQGSGPQVGAAFSWTEDDRILVMADDGLYLVPATGGSLVRLTEVDSAAGELVHHFGQMLPGGRAVLFNVMTDSDVPSDWTIVVQSLEGDERRTVVDGGSAPVYLASGHVVFARHGALMAVPFDADRLEVTGDPVVVLEDVMHGEGGANSGLNIGAAQFSVSDTGSLTYVPGGIYPGTANRVVLVDRSGEAEPLRLPPARHLWPRLSPDGTRVSYAIGNFGDYQVWVYDLELDIPRSLATPGQSRYAVWSPDSTRLAVGDASGMYSIAADGSGAAERLGENVGGNPSSWSAESGLAFLGGDPGIWTLRMDGRSQPESFVDTRSSYPAFSPDGRWLAYVNSEDGQVYVRPFPEGAPVVRVSPEGGSQPVWSLDGTQLFYTKGNRDTGALQVIVVDVVTEPAFRPSPPRLLFDGAYVSTVPIRSFDISPDGDRFVMLESVALEPQPVTSVRVVLNWFEELKRLAPAR